MPKAAAACVVATLAFWAYTQTLLPGVDLGDTGGFQAAVLWSEVSARQAYPLYYGLARPFVQLVSNGNPARGLNLFSAVWGAAAAGLLTFVCARVTRAPSAGVVAGVLLAFSYTFWSQAVIAEVYTLHLALLGCCLAALAAYAARPGFLRLVLFFGVYAVSFGNHLSMILLIGPFAFFLFLTTPDPRDLVTPRTIAAALAIAAIAALQYAPNLMAVQADAWSDRAAGFWFDVTKQDWRESMVLGVGADQAGSRMGMWWFDARQQFGVPGLALAVAGLVALWQRFRPWAWLVATSYAASTLFAITYNVGDAHVFFLPGHFMTAFAAGAGGCALSSIVGRALSGSPREPERVRATGILTIALILVYAGWRGWDDWPALDRHEDRRGEQLIASLTFGVGDSHAVFVSRMNWQIENVLLYTGRYLRTDLAWVRLGDVMTHWPFFADDNRQLGRDLVLNGDAAAEVASVFGADAPLVEDPAAPVLPMEAAFRQVPRGMPYVLVVLTPPQESPLDRDAFAAGLLALTAPGGPMLTEAPFQLFAGVAGDRPLLHRAADRPFTEHFRVLDEPITVRMESWLPTDTFRRAGFGHVLRGRERLLFVERGVNLVWLGRGGAPSRPYYAASLFAPQPRFRIPAATLQYASGR